jgi:phosphohistidine phosphatase SixA
VCRPRLQRRNREGRGTLEDLYGWPLKPFDRAVIGLARMRATCSHLVAREVDNHEKCVGLFASASRAGEAFADGRRPRQVGPISCGAGQSANQRVRAMSAADQIIILRHARAGKKISNRSKDFKRGLDRKGEAVARQLPELITGSLCPSAILSSPFRRCLETVEPLAEAIDLAVVEDDRFSPNSRAIVRDAFADVAADSVVCTHGEVIVRLLGRQAQCAKGAFWVVERREGNFVPLRYVKAPSIRDRA